MYVLINAIDTMITRKKYKTKIMMHCTFAYNAFNK